MLAMGFLLKFLKCRKPTVTDEENGKDLGTEEGAMVFEYVSNRNLQEKLHGNKIELLPWKTCMSIAFQLAEAIEYLHNKCTLRISIDGGVTKDEANNDRLAGVH
ncbi:hypothetical protein V6N13_142508 [Hibiscus sabdariffa]